MVFDAPDYGPNPAFDPAPNDSESDSESHDAASPSHNEAGAQDSTEQPQDSESDSAQAPASELEAASPQDSETTAEAGSDPQTAPIPSEQFSPESIPETSNNTESVSAPDSDEKAGSPVASVRVLSLVLDNFKSFANKTTIRYRDGFTTISGPNGSGKSNIIDSLLFVLGLASSKGMRAERLTDLMNANSKKKYARVALNLEITHEDGSVKKLEIARRVRLRKKTYDSRYELDGEAIKASDLQQTLLELGLTASGMNVVLQGDVMRLATMSPLNRRRVLDETAGISEFDRRITAAREELNQASRHMEDIQLILNELESRRDALKDERETALEYRRLREVRHSMEEELIVLEAQKARDEALNLEKQLDNLAQRRDKLKAVYDKSLVTLEAAKKQLEVAERNYKAKGENERLGALKKREALKGKITNLNDKITRLNSDIQNAIKQDQERGEEVTKLKSKSEQIDSKEQTLHVKLEELGEKHLALSEEVNTAMNEIRRHGAAQADTIEELNRLQVVTRTLRNQDDELSRRESELVEKSANLNTEGKLLREKVHENSSRRESLAGREENSSQARKVAREKLATQEERQRRFYTQLSQVRNDRERNLDTLSDLKNTLAREEEKIKAAQAYTNNLALRTVRQSGIQGILGTVQELMSVDPEYAEAIEAAAGGRLQWVIVENEHIGKDCIELLKRTKAGRLTFVPLTKIRPKNYRYDRLGGAGIIDYAIDLVEFDERYEKVFMDVFQDTVVIETLKAGLKHMNRYRMVSLDGDILERGGRMTGGRRKNSRSRILAEVSNAEKLVRDLRNRVKEAETRRDALAREESRTEAEIRKISAELSSFKERVAETGASQLALKEELETIDKSLQPAKTRLQQVEVQLEASTKELNEIREKRKEIGSQLGKDDARLKELSEENEGSAFEILAKQTAEKEVQLRDLESTMSTIRDSYQNIRLEKRSLAEKLATLELNLEESKERQTQLTTELKTAKEQQVTDSAELKVLEEELGKIVKELEELDEKRKDALKNAQKEEQGSVLALREFQSSELGLESAREKVSEAQDHARVKLEELAAKNLGPVPEYPEDGYEQGEDPKALQQEITRGLKKTIAKMESLEPVNMLAIDQYDEIAERESGLRERFDALTSERDGLIQRMVDLEEAKKTTFMSAFEAVRLSFQNSFRELARGEGELRLENEEDPFAGGLIIEARPRGKSFTRLEAMSGGEKSLTALAFIFALQSVNPAPFYIFDEVDQSLDGANTELLALAIQKRSRSRQYLVVSHHQAMLNESDQLLGVNMRKGFGTRVTGISLKKDKAEAAAAAVTPAQPTT